MGAHQLKRRRALAGFCLLFLGATCSLIPLGQRTLAATNPPVGTTWSISQRSDPGQPGELNVTWTVRLESVNNETVSLRYTFTGEVGFITDASCVPPAEIPLPWTRLSVQASFSGGGSSPPPVFFNEALATAKPDYQAPSFFQCWSPLTDPPAYYPGAITYVRYVNYRFSTIQSGIPTEFFSKFSAVNLSATPNASPDGSTFLGGNIPIPVIGIDAQTTTTTSQNTTSTLKPGSTTTTNATATTTLPDEDLGTTNIPVEVVVPDVTAEPGDNDPGVGTDVVDVSYNMEDETPVQETQRKEDTANSLAVTAAVLISSLAAAAPALGAVSAAGALGGVIGVASSRSFSGGQLLPQVPKPTDSAVQGSKSALLKKLEKIPDGTSPPDPVLENSLVTPTTGRAAQGGTLGVELAHVGRLFAAVISGLQHMSRLRMFRPGLRRWAEVALVSPLLAAATPVFLLLGSGLMAALRTNDIISSTVAMVGLFALSVFAPVFSMFVVIGWCVGRVLWVPGSLGMGLSESVALLPGVLFLPMMVRNLVGPRTRSRSWEHVLALVLAPCVAALVYRNWLLHFADVTGSLSRKMVSTFGGDSGRRLLGVESETTALVVGVLMAALVMLISVVAVRCSDVHGRPVVMFRRFVQELNPTQILRREYVDLAAVELGEPSRWGRWMRYGSAGLLSTYALSEVLGLKSVVLVVVFLVAVAITKRSPRTVMKNEVHPIVKTLPMVGVGLFLGAVSVSPSRVFIAFAIMTVLAAATSLVRTRALWDS